MKKELIVKNINVNFFSQKEEDFISLTDIAKYKNPDDPRFVIQNWMKTHSIVEFLGIWEQINNPDFNRVEFDTFKNEADVLNIALFGKTAKQWRDENLKLKGNMRDYANVIQLVFTGLESLNAEFIRQEITQSERLIKLNQIAIIQMKSLTNNTNTKKLT